MAQSTVKKGNYYKRRTKKHFESLGYQTEYLEKLIGIKSRKGIIYIKKDLFYSDGISIKPDGTLIFWQSKLGKKNLADAVAKYKSFNVKAEKIVVHWEKGDHLPELIVVENEQK